MDRTPRYGKEVALVFDLGMCYGEDAEFYLKKGFKVVSVEANPALCDRARTRFAREVGCGQLVVVNGAVADKPGRIDFYVCRDEPARSTTVPELRDFWARQGETFEAIEVSTITVDDLFSRFGEPYYLKSDVEGQDLTVLRSLSRIAIAPSFLSFEVDFSHLREAMALLEGLGYRKFGLVDQRSVPDQVVPHPACEGGSIDHRFHVGCSGLFGREFPQQWEPAEALKRRSRRVVWQYRLRGAVRRLARATGGASVADKLISSWLPEANTWYDIHASRLP